MLDILQIDYQVRRSEGEVSIEIYRSLAEKFFKKFLLARRQYRNLQKIPVDKAIKFFGKNYLAGPKICLAGDFLVGNLGVTFISSKSRLRVEKPQANYTQSQVRFIVTGIQGQAFGFVLIAASIGAVGGFVDPVDG